MATMKRHEGAPDGRHVGDEVTDFTRRDPLRQGRISEHFAQIRDQPTFVILGKELHIEDQVLPKKCGHLNDKKLADARYGGQGRGCRQGLPASLSDCTNRSVASEGLDAAVDRARLYLEAGADAIFPEALATPEMFREFARRLPNVPLLANMTEFGRTPFLTAAEFEAMGYARVIWPVSSLRVANEAQQRLYAAIRRDGETKAMTEEMQTRAELYDLIGLKDYEALDASIVATIVPRATS